MPSSVIMQARSSTSGALITWPVASPDWTGASFPGPGNAVDVAVVASEQGGALPGARGGVRASFLGEVQTSSTTATVLATYKVSATELSLGIDVVVTNCRRTSATKVAKMKRDAEYQRTASANGGSLVLVGAISSGTDKKTVADDVTFTLTASSGSGTNYDTVNVVVTAADTDPRNWMCELRVQETLAT